MKYFGFVYVREAEEMMDELRDLTAKTIEECFADGDLDSVYIKSRIKDEIGRYINQKTKRRPMVLPILMQI